MYRNTQQIHTTRQIIYWDKMSTASLLEKTLDTWLWQRLITRGIDNSSRLFMSYSSSNYSVIIQDTEPRYMTQDGALHFCAKLQMIRSSIPFSRERQAAVSTQSRQLIVGLHLPLPTMNTRCLWLITIIVVEITLYEHSWPLRLH